MRLVGLPHEIASLHLPAQRIWLLARTEPATSRDGGDVRSYAGAVLLLGQHCVYGLVIISSDAARASEESVFARCVDGDPGLTRDAFAFAGLDAALTGMDQLRAQFLKRGWLEPPRDHGRGAQ